MEILKIVSRGLEFEYKESKVDPPSNIRDWYEDHVNLNSLCNMPLLDVSIIQIGLRDKLTSK